MKLAHTADWQVGMKAAGLGAAGARIREERLNAGRRIVETATSYGAEFILVAGDLFEDNAVDRVLVQKVADILSAFSGPVFIIPGNHDPLVPGSVWEHPAWKSAGNLHILREEAPVEVTGGILYPCPLFEKNSGRNPTAWIPSEATGKIRIGVAHGTVEGVRQDEPDYPIPRDAAQGANLDYLAIGHWHSYATYPGPDGAVRMAYSGTHETTKFSERDSGNVLIVEIPAPGAPPTITPVRTGGLVWKSIDKEARERGDLGRMREEIEAIENPGTTLVEVRLAGLLMAEEWPEIDHIQQILASRFVSGRVDVSRLRPSPEDDNWLSVLPPGIIREAANRLRATAYTPGAQSETAARALMELYAIVGESAQ
ncbi:MAG: DNA repair exonuclease [candidate division NC10 bacterium]